MRSDLAPEHAAHFATDSTEVLREVRESGFCVIDFSAEIEGVVRECTNILDAQNADSAAATYKMGQGARLYTDGVLTQIEQDYPHLFNFFNQAFFREVHHGLLANEHFCRDIFMTREVPGDTMDRNGYLHFDRLWALKFMLYLSDVDEHSGAFSVIPGTHKLGARLRREQWQITNQYADVLNRLEIDYPDLGYSKKQAQPLTGKAGTVIVFDSDIFHYGGVIDSKYPHNSRFVVRAHCRA